MMGEHLTSSCEEVDQQRLYDDLAWIWPIISPPEDYAEEAKEFRDLIHQHTEIDVKTVLHLGCGAGHLDHNLKKYFQIVGVDLSDAFLNLAHQLNPEVHYRKGDMRTVRLGETFDAVIIADSIDYMLSAEDLQAAFKTAHQHLKPEGVFCTYAEETKERFQQNKTQFRAHQHEEIEITSIDQFYDPDPADNTYQMTFVYLIRKGGELIVEVDRHVAGLFSLGEWVENLERAGFVPEIITYETAGPSFVCRKAL